MSVPNALLICSAILGQPKRGFLFFISIMAFINSGAGPLGPGFFFAMEDEKILRYFRFTSALWDLSSVAGLTTIPIRRSRFLRTHIDPIPKKRRSQPFKLGARFRPRLSTSIWCFNIKVSAINAFAPPGRVNLTRQTIR